ncbi:MAG TPA: DNA-binding protein [Tepidisphaeraceae bacterium]|nr:DNA-binding protein [Tepidisphaeraceae bacterium]
MAERKPFLLRIDSQVLEQIQHWANDDLRSLNGQIEFLLRRVLAESGRAKSKEPSSAKLPSDAEAP